jgi:hypothetical protein
MKLLTLKGVAHPQHRVNPRRSLRDGRLANGSVWHKRFSKNVFASLGVERSMGRVEPTQRIARITALTLLGRRPRGWRLHSGREVTTVWPKLVVSIRGRSIGARPAAHVGPSFT